MYAISARDFMTKRLITLRTDVDVLDAVRTLLKHNISGAPVVDRCGKYLGVFSEKCSMQVLLDAAYEQMPTTDVGSFMDTEAQTIGPDTQLLSIAQVFLLTGYRRLPVIDDDGYLLGQVSRRDVIRAAMKTMDTTPVKERNLLYLSAIISREDAPMV